MAEVSDDPQQTRGAPLSLTQARLRRHTADTDSVCWRSRCMALSRLTIYNGSRTKPPAVHEPTSKGTGSGLEGTLLVLLLLASSLLCAGIVVCPCPLRTCP